MSSLKPAFWTFRPNEAMVNPWAVSCTAASAKRPRRKTSPPNPIFFATTNGVP